jgi:hypothetical protein
LSKGKAEKTAKGPDWKAARAVWACAGVDLPKSKSKGKSPYLKNLENAAAAIREATAVTDTDNARDWSPKQIADQCQSLSDSMSRIDDTAYARIEGPASISVSELVAETIINLDQLETAFRNARVLRKPRKKKQAHNNFLVDVMANLFEEEIGRAASVTTDPVTDERKGPFVEFVISFADHFLSGDTKNLNGRAIHDCRTARRANQPQ